MKTNIQLTKQTRKQKSGFTLIEVIAVLVLLGILAAIAVPRYVDMTQNARNRAIDAAVSELTGREALEWGNELLSTAGFTAGSNAAIRARVANGAGALGGGYVLSEITDTGASVSFQGNTAVPLTRSAASASGPAVWSR